MRRAGLVVSMTLAALAASSLDSVAQTAGTNPDISAIASFVACPAGAEDCPDPEAEGDLEFQELELALQGYLNPYVRGDIFASWHGEDAEIEEAFATVVRGLGPVQARFGKYLVDWGSLNPLHPHAYSWIFRPLVEERFFGEEGLNQIGVGVNAAWPLGVRGELRIAADLLRGDLQGDAHGHDEAEEEEEIPTGTICVGPGCEDGICEPGDADCALVHVDSPVEEELDEGPERAWRVGASYFTEFRPMHSVRVAANALWGSLDPVLDRDVRWVGADVKYRWRPDKYRSLNVFAAVLRNRAHLEGERLVAATCVGPDCIADVCPAGGVCTVVEQHEHVRGDEISTTGGYVIADWQFAERWNAGVKLDRAEGLDSEDHVERTEAFLNFRLMEESTLFRLLVRREDGDLLAEPHDTAALQAVFSLGPHKPHSF